MNMRISVNDLYKSYGKKTILHGFDGEFSLKEGRIIGLVGPNGAGKTTLLKVISGILGYDSGIVQLDSNGSAHFDKWCKSHVVLINSGERGLRYKSTVYDNVMYFCALKGASLIQVKKLYNVFADLLHFSDFSARKVETLSTGEMKKANILCGLCANTDVIVLDEPTSGLDIEATADLQECLVAVAKSLSSTLIVSSHDVDFLSSITSNFVFIFDGKNVFETNAHLTGPEIKNKYFELREQYRTGGV